MTATDLTLPGALPLQFTRTHLSSQRFASGSDWCVIVPGGRPRQSDQASEWAVRGRAGRRAR
ncbi:DUF6531 domain-containing protein [Streptomyces griseus]|uniref:DUF6531 domain-containing protein n=1 Tax=Streptomyces griseus TaxID=1911 RepID=UPI001F3DBF05|nr:DUF6531 domain-containing protein [Streptomyces griseus]